MAQQPPSENYGFDYLSDLNVRLRDLEEKQSMIKDRVLLIGENLVSSKDETNQEIAEIKIKILDLESEMKKTRLAIERIISEFENITRKNEFDILKRQFEMFEPLKIARISDVENMIRKAMAKKG